MQQAWHNRSGLLGLTLTLGIGLFFSVLCPNEGFAEERVDYVDFHLTEGRVCKQCAFRILGPDSPSSSGQVEQIELYNRLGQSTIVAPKEILGINKHPWLRKFYLFRLKEAGITGPIIAPEGYEELKQRARYRQK